ncbi:Argininosuccinate synthase [Buchnera aphidicola (Sipha maydis)]|uniref:argininosuccinate synthase n=1 Tax=Buchnera aphidicola TaxID=9 RepID=UPI002543B45E|nr:argininosuccinate synthase [Buchnera aphidicola]WII23718.1 argininosuccinate synthase [Buchnera aphidicola (Sipha maydis)]
MSKKIVVLAYSGGLDTSAIIPWIKENYNLNVFALVVDIGQSKKDLKGIEEKAISSGAIGCQVIDLKEDFVNNYVYPLLKIGALYEGKYFLGTAIARPIIAEAQVHFAKKIGAVALAHGATGKGNDQIRFEMTYSALSPELKVISPWREWDFKSRESLLKYLKEKNISTTATLEKIYSRDENIFHISTEGGILEDLWKQPTKDCWVWTRDVQDTPNKPDYITLKIKNGFVYSINGEKNNPYHCLKQLNKLGSIHGIGRLDIVENRLIGIKSRGCYETPGGTIIYEALRSLEQLVLDKESMKWRNTLALEMSHLVYDGKWFSPMRESIQCACNKLSTIVTGKVVLKLYKGTVIAVQKKSENTLYSQSFSTFSEDNVYTQSDASGFINLFSLSTKIRSLKQK